MDTEYFSEADPDPDIWHLRLYIAGRSPKSILALSNLARICQKYPAHTYRLEVVDLLKTPDSARANQIVATPTLVRLRPEPERRLVGDLSNRTMVSSFLELDPYWEEREQK